jgi:hypothetical protein
MDGRGNPRDREVRKVDSAAYDASDFEMISETSGALHIQMMGVDAEIPYSSKNHLNREGTIGYSLYEAGGRSAYVFLSRVGSLDVITMTGAVMGPSPAPIEGMRVWSVPDGSGPEEHLAQHLSNLGEDQPERDPATLKEKLPHLAQRSSDITSKMMEALMASMGDLEGLESQMDEALSQVRQALESLQPAGEAGLPGAVGLEGSTLPPEGGDADGEVDATAASYLPDDPNRPA